jgi:hypothetical protein
MKVYIVNDTSSFHAGSWAVITSLKQKLATERHTIIHTTPRPLGPERHWIEECDALVVNGEGAMQEESKAWDDGRVTKIMKGLELAKQMGKRAYLVNSVWYRMNRVWGDVLRSLDGLWVREIASQREMEREQGVRPDVFLDLSYSCKLDTSVKGRPLAGRDVVGTFYSRNMARGERFGRYNWQFWGSRHLGLRGTAEHSRRPADWSYVVHSLLGANVYATGQHHGVYAACRARVPFAVFKLYNHKIQGLLEWAGVDIPVAANLKELVEGIRWAKANRDVFDRLFDWMDRQPVWPGLRASHP